ncbi:cytidylate kinase [Siminovitchia terrae]|uniref:Cytidylate kinase n=1 Tax=Siminovitchia terrae TaxID=1914933 RepID=A0ABQ4KWU4_SIMTE|nr:(d)CMP kinase [Siminovitchia terrae]GIN92045.1 cytidylate kinase [Siminovitchia terrae]GIN96518.1 cytidylate kinase [Siminovitchia terrae]
MTKKISIAIDGPAAAGKSTVAKIVAEKLSYIYIDTGAMYRAVTYKALMEGTDIHDEESLFRLLKGTTIDLVQESGLQTVFLDGKDVTKEIRNSNVTNNVSTVAAHGAIREEMVHRQRELGKRGGVVMDGRDIGTKVLPDSELKVFLLASVDIRAERRHKENVEKGYPSDLAQLKEEIMLRDKNDTEREVSPLVKAEDAIEIDTSTLSIEEVVAHIIALAKERIERP